jgi:hypothetical protein
MVYPVLARGGYGYTTQVHVGQRCGGRTHKVDAIATKGDEKILISLKWQQTGGTAEQKVHFEVMCLADAVRAQQATRAYLVLGGDGWTLRDYYTSGALAETGSRAVGHGRDFGSVRQISQQRSDLTHGTVGPGSGTAKVTRVDFTAVPLGPC